MISAHHITKVYSNGRGITDVSIEVAAGKLVGLVGPNGAGKTTLLRVLIGLARADTGEVGFGKEHPDAGIRDVVVGSVQEDAALFDLLTGEEHLNFVGQLYALGQTLRMERIVELARVLELGDGMGRPIATYSKGMRRKLAFAAAILADPRVLILDEPFEGVDPLSVLAMKEILRQFAVAGTAVLITSHMLSLVEDVCGEFVLISEGAVRFAGDRDALLARLGAEGSGNATGNALEKVFFSIVAPDRQPVVLSTLADPTAGRR